MEEAASGGVDFSVVIAFIAASTPVMYGIWMALKSMTIGKRLIDKA